MIYVYGTFHGSINQQYTFKGDVTTSGHNLINFSSKNPRLASAKHVECRKVENIRKPSLPQIEKSWMPRFWDNSPAILYMIYSKKIWVNYSFHQPGLP